MRQAAFVLIASLVHWNDRLNPLHTASITSDWLTEVLRPFVPGVQVISVRHLDKMFGTTTHLRVELEYNTAGIEAGLPQTMYLKLAPREPATRVFISLFNLAHHETRFYNEIAPQVSGIVPRTFYATAARRGPRFALLMEDLQTTGQIKDVTHPCSFEEACAVVKSLATVHSAFWNSPRFEDDLDWLITFRTDPNVRLNRLMRRWALKKTLATYSDIIPAEVRQEGAYINRKYDDLERYWGQPPETLIHGDPHIGNMYFSDHGAGLLDWQVVRRGQGMRDISYFLVSSLPIETRLAHQEDLINLYLDHLRGAGITAPDFQQAWEQYRLHTFYTWIAQIVTAAAGTLQQERIVRTGLSRTAQAIVDLDSLEALRAM